MNLFCRNAHVPDAMLLLLLEEELHGRRLLRAERHLSACSECRLRRYALMETDRQVSGDRPAAMMGVPRETPSGPARERLAALLAREPQITQVPLLAGTRRLPVLRRSVLLRGAGVAVLLVLSAAWRQLDLPLQDRMAAYEETGPEPNHSLTPGSANPVTLNELCGLSDAQLDPRLSPEKERAVFRAYGMDESAARAYQVDYLINPQLGGNDRIENLWPEPYHATVWNARAKDALEARLHGMVCSGQVDLRAAQRELSTDWIAAYKKYFHAQRPVRTVAELDVPPTFEAALP